MFLKILVSNLDLQGLREIIKRPYWMVCGLFLFLFFSRCCFYIQCGLKNYFCMSYSWVVQYWWVRSVRVLLIVWEWHVFVCITVDSGLSDPSITDVEQPQPGIFEGKLKGYQLKVSIGQKPSLFKFYFTIALTFKKKKLPTKKISYKCNL